jgi:hypothetical protein
MRVAGDVRYSQAVLTGHFRWSARVGAVDSRWCQAQYRIAKIVRVLKKLDANAPHSVVLVLDATTGQNAINQVQIFQEIAGVTNLVVTKLDGTARGGILVAIAERFGLPINAIGIGEGIEDFEPFDEHLVLGAAEEITGVTILGYIT